MASWSDRHWAGRSNPWCVTTRLAAALALIWAVNSYRDLGPYALVPIGSCLFFIIINPFIFPAPRDDSKWATKSVLGQRAWRGTPRRWDWPTLYRILSGTIYFAGLVASLEGMLVEGLLLGVVALACKLGYLDWMAKYYLAQKTA